MAPRMSPLSCFRRAMFVRAKSRMRPALASSISIICPDDGKCAEVAKRVKTRRLACWKRSRRRRLPFQRSRTRQTAGPHPRRVARLPTACRLPLQAPGYEVNAGSASPRELLLCCGVGGDAGGNSWKVSNVNVRRPKRSHTHS